MSSSGGGEPNFAFNNSFINNIELEDNDTDHEKFHLNPYLKEKKRQFEEERRNENNFYITTSWSPQIYFSVRGAENFHIYLVSKNID